MDCKIIFSDVDGTLLNGERTISESTIYEVNRLKDTVPFILVSSRMPRQMRYLQNLLKTIDYPIIAYNGALVLSDDGQVLHSTEIDITLVEQIVQLNEQQFNGKIHISLYHNDLWYVPDYDFWAQREENNTKTTPEIRSNSQVITDWKEQNIGAHKIMLMGDAMLIEEMFTILNSQFGQNLHIYRAKDTYIEVSDLKVSKLTGIRVLLEHKYPFTLDESMAFGDNYNDLEMLQGVKYGIAVGNARQEVKKIAYGVTFHHKEDGVARYLASFFHS
ncbi:HAD family hydrolase [Capnocytophaga canis]|uniref:HAD family hydrolase n=1 Tax=Capnocytophaga canis TaxID=1848903 RepID=UPI00385AB8C2